MNFMKMLEGALHGQVKPMITQCCMRHLYNAQPKNEIVINHAKGFERRRCNHHELEKPLSTMECLSSVVDPKSTRTNKHRYVVATQHQDIQEYMQSIPGVPIVYILRSVMIMKPMSDVTVQTRAREEDAKFRMGLKGARGATAQLGGNGEGEGDGDEDAAAPKKKQKKGPAAPNPLSSKAPSKAKIAERERSAQESKSANRRKRRRIVATPNNDVSQEIANDFSAQQGIDAT